MVSFAPALVERKKKMKYSINFDKVNYRWEDVAINRCVCCGKANTVICYGDACVACEDSEKWYVMRGGRRPL